jgi:hypothetical protein
MISELRKSDSPVQFQIFNVSALYLNRTLTILLRADQMATEIFPPLCFLLIV